MQTDASLDWGNRRGSCKRIVMTEVSGNTVANSIVVYVVRGIDTIVRVPHWPEEEFNTVVPALLHEVLRPREQCVVFVF